MHFTYDELDYETVITRSPDGTAMGVSKRRRDPAEAARLKYEREMKREDAILAEASAIRRRRGINHEQG